MTNAKYIATRLRIRSATHPEQFGLDDEAADLIEQQAAEIERLRLLSLHYVQDIDNANAQIDALREENENLRKACATGWGEPVLVNTLRAEVEKLRADAERWRAFLGTRPANTHEVICAAIDAAMKGTP